MHRMNLQSRAEFSTMHHHSQISKDLASDEHLSFQLRPECVPVALLIVVNSVWAWRQRAERKEQVAAAMVALAMPRKPDQAFWRRPLA
jgi:hypothetical protein